MTTLVDKIKIFIDLSHTAFWGGFQDKQVENIFLSVFEAYWAEPQELEIRWPSES